ncbi:MULTISPECIES: Uma2 family endonuclease [unclassified Coleofasciculus]|uniref:Uma2 family endonuclease n=1 Tax=unclassified Coleofasciculus TaxID=2692782 RepID=UPI0018802D1E|nr:MULTISPECIES: Uma2 family endonuclease [unclassified Coleofasciculus]MBE9125848.1 Uma2 family endonuclease [Coleofasciculus sp. LEGE 07081]MBE9149167.1 Uma2 family endonuclease [Coleofasciculus sp. LEGE 07092]
MVQTSSKTLTLEEFLELPETKPASEYIDGKIIQKPMPKARHSRLQSKLINAVNKVTEERRIAYAFPELRCTFGARSIVPDVAVLRWDSIKFDENGEPIDDVLIPPDWTIEILSPDQSSNRVTGNILHCLTYGCQLGWLLDPDDRSILVFQPKKQPELRQGNDDLMVLDGIELNLTVEQVFNWLKMNDSDQTA